MNVRRTFRNSVALGLAAALPVAALWQIALATAPAHATAKHQPPLRALAARLHTLLAPAPPSSAPAVNYSTSFHLSDYLAPKYSVNYQKGSLLQRPRPVIVDPHVTTPTGGPVTLVPYSAGEVVHITNAAGQTVRAPQSLTDTSIAPNHPLTFTVTVDNVTTDASGNPTTTPAASTTATHVYLQFKNPNSAYQGTDGLEHKVFTTDFRHTGADGVTPGGLSSRILFNGGGGGAYSLQNNADVLLQGAVGGSEGTAQLLGIGRGPVTTTNGVPGPPAAATMGNFVSWGQEYECQYLDPMGPAGYTGTSDATYADYGAPRYLAGYDDQQAGSFPGVPTDGNGPEWLELTQSSTNVNQYTATWSPPASASDFYMDVIVVDNQNNWRIFDNVWGFSTLPFQGTNDILFVADNVLGQKFAASALSTNGLANLRPVFYGAESYFTGINTNLLPNGVYDYGGTTPAPRVSPVAGAGPYNSYTVGPVLNGLGYGSYADSITDNMGALQTTNYQPANSSQLLTQSVGLPTPAVYPKSQAYSIWRILCRGALDPTLLTRTPAQGGYARNGFAGDGTTGTQPAVQDPSSGFSAPASATVPVNTRCVVWASPFTGDQPLNTAGSILDSATQQILRTYVAAGGRLFVTGQEIASALTLNGIPAINAAGGFVYDVLNAQYMPPTVGSQVDNQTLTGTSGNGNPLGNDSIFNFVGPPVFDDDYSNFLQVNATGADSFVAPGSVVPSLGNDYDGNADTGVQTKWRTDGALTQLGPYTVGIGSSTIQSNINLVTPVNGAISQYGINGSSGMIYKSDTTDAVGSGYGSRVIFSSFGLEGVGIEYYKVTIGNPGVDYFYPRNVRPNILHNIVSYLRTGAYEGRIFLGSSTSVGVAGATVYLIPFHGTTIPGPRQTYSATTSDGTDGRLVGSYHIDGLEPGAYIAVAYKTGYTRASSPTFNGTALPYTTIGDTTATNVNLNITPLPPGSIAGKVTLMSTGAAVAGATVTFTTADGTVVTATTAADGTYSTSAPAGTYSGIARSTTPAAVSPTQTGIVVNTAQTTQNINFALTPSPGTLTGQVALTGVSSTATTTATVAFTASGATSPAATTTVTLTGTTPGTYTSPSLPGGTYTISVSATGYVATNSDTATVVLGQTTPVSPTLTLRAASTVTLNGIVTDATTANGTPIANATITVKDLANSTVATTPSPIVTDSTGHYSAMLLEGTYNITASAYSYNSVNRTVTLTTTSGTVQNFALTHATPAYSGYKAGLYNMVSYPYEYDAGGSTPFDGLFGSEFATATSASNRGPALIYSSSARNYLTEPTAPADGVHLGRGYFVFLKSVAAIYNPLLGTPPTGSTISVALQGGGSLDGWNMIGVPSTAAVSVSRVQIQFANGATTSFTNAANNNAAVSPNIYGYNPAANAYFIVGSNGSLQPYQGYWVRAKISGLNIIIPTSGP